MSISTIVFDFGNVLGFFSHRKAAEQLAAYSPLSADDIMRRYLDPQLEDDFESGRMSLPAFRDLVRQRCQVRCSDEQLDLAIADMFAANDEVCALVPALKPRYRLVLLSNTNELHALHFRRQFADTLAHFDTLILSHEVGLRKPCPEIYAHCCKLAACSPTQALFIDDMPANIEAARACGWQGIDYHRGLDLSRELRQRGIELPPPHPQPLSPCTQGERGVMVREIEVDMNPIEQNDAEVWQAIVGERLRQQNGLEMIASENYTSPAVLAAQGSVLTNKYAEGYPGRRYYGGCEFVDVVERLAIERVLKLFGAESANVQPHSGAQANMAVYFACLEPGDTILAMNLAHGGHLTHGMHLNFSGKLYRIVPYGVRADDQRIDYDQVAQLAREHKPKLIVAGASAYPRIIDFARFAEISRESGALLMVDMAHIAGLVAGEQHPSPVPWAHFVTSTTHKTLRGPRAGFVLCKKDWAAKINQAVFPGMQGGPLMHVIAAKAIGFAEALQPSFRGYAAQTIANARALAHELTARQFRLVSGGTDNHLLLVDVASRGLTGKVAEKSLDAAGITINRNGIPFDTRPPFDPSGIRIGTPALTTRGMRKPEMRQIGAWIGEVLAAPDDISVQTRVRQQVQELCQQFPAPANEE